MLLQVRDTLRHAARSSDLIIRWGGDEFLVIARHTDADEAEELAERIRSRIADRIMVLDDGTVVKTTCSVGFACYPFLREQAGRLAWEQVMAVADRAMYMAKESRNAWVGLVSTPETANVDRPLREHRERSRPHDRSRRPADPQFRAPPDGDRSLSMGETG